MNPTNIVKWAVLAGVLIAAISALSAVGRLGAERSSLRNEVATEVEVAAGGSHTVTTPMLVVEFTESWLDEAQVAQQQRWQYVLIASEVNARMTSAVSTRYRGIFPARVANTRHDLRATFVAPAAWFSPWRDGAQRGLTAAYVAFGASSPRGLRDITGGVRAVTDADASAMPLAFAARVANEATLLSGVGDAQLIASLAPAALAALRAGPLRLDLGLTSSGGGRVNLVPLAQAISIEHTSDWSHLKYAGRLPADHALARRGSTARWQLDGLSEGLAATYDGNSIAALVAAVSQGGVQLAFIDPVDVYASLERAVKHGWLIVLVTLALVLLFESTRGLRLHPVQYGLVAFGLVLFFLLLLSLGEHVGFAAAYLVAATATCALCVAYLMALFRRVALGLSFAGYFAGVYLSLYVILRSEDFALLLGACLLLVGLAIAMWLTRRLHLIAEMLPPSAANGMSTDARRGDPSA
ncbi:MAG: inner membrane CreD family protein [Myxococcales bacterium]|nr:inner membrane CreD family protein [Myxococcales bacterium]